MEKTLIFIKPDVFERNLIEKVDEDIRTFVTDNNLEITTEYQGNLLEKFLRYHYAVHLDKSFYNDLISDLRNQQFHAYVLEGDDAVALVRNNLQTAIRDQYQKNNIENSLHASDSNQTANYEIDNFTRFYN